MKKLLIFTLIYIATFSISIAQTPLDKAIWKYEDKNYVDAATELEKLLPKISSEKTKVDVIIKLANSYYFLNDFSRAQKWYEEAEKLQANSAEMFVNYGDVLSHNGKYEKAKEMYAKAESDTTWGKIAKVKAKNAQNATSIEELPGVLIHNNLKSLNSEMGDYGFSLIDEKTAIFTSSSLLYGKTKDKKTGQGFSRLILANKDKNGEWKAISALPENINSLYNNGSFTYDPIHKVGYFSQCNGPDGKGKNCVLLSTSYDPSVGKWGNPEMLPFCDDGWNYAHPAISPDGKTLFFTSDRPGGLGGKDIFKSSKGSGHNAWGQPTNLGSEINTIGNEAFPSIGGDSIFYFSSNARQGIGGYDIYKADFNNASPKNVRSLPAPFNSPADDFGFVQSPTSKFEGFYCSNRTGGVGGDDIYYFELDPKFKTIGGQLTEENTGNPISNATVIIQGSDGSTYEVKTDNNGKFKLDNINPEAGYKILGSADGYFSASSTVKALNLASNTDQTNQLNERNNAKISLIKITKDEIKLDNIYYAYNKADLTDESKKELQKLITLLKETPNISIVINSHSDEQGSDKYNLDLSERRAKSVVNYLIDNGIEAHRLSSKGWGESNPIYKNASSEEQHAANRRTTFQVTNAQ